MNQPFQLSHGVNASHWLSQSKRRGEERDAFFTEEDVRRIADWGLDHIRLPVDEEHLYHEDGSIDEQGFALLQNGLDWALKHKLRVVVDLHILRSHHFNQQESNRLYEDPAEQQRFADIWRELSRRIGDRDVDQVAYELLNEPVAKDDEDWNRVYRVAYDALREREPGRVIVIGSNWFQNCKTFDALTLPEGDDKIVMSYHFYHPMFITHYQAKWTPTGDYAGPIQYPGKPVPDEGVAMMSETYRARLDAWTDWNAPVDAAVLEAQMAKPLAKREANGLPLYCGEFGCIDFTPHDIRKHWLTDTVAIFRKHNVGFAMWDYRGHFGLLDPEGNDNGLVKLLTG